MRTSSFEINLSVRSRKASLMPVADHLISLCLRIFLGNLSLYQPRNALAVLRGPPTVNDPITKYFSWSFLVNCPLSSRKIYIILCAKFFHIAGNLRFKLIAFFERAFELRRELFYFFLKRHAVIYFVGKSDIATGGEHEARFGDVLRLHRFAETGGFFIFRRALFSAPGTHCVGDFSDVVVGEGHLLARDLLKLLARIYEKRLSGTLAKAVAVLVFRDKPKRHGKPDIVEKLRRAGDNHIHEVIFNYFLANLSLAPADCERAIRHHEPRHAVGSEVMNEVLNPSEVCV